MISVCIASYNGEKYIKEQLSSILEELSQYDEIVISDDGSVDDTLAIIHSFNDSRIRLIENSNRQGIVSNFENALKNARGEYIFLSDQDDVWIAGKIEKFMLQFQKGYRLILSDAIVVNETLEEIHDSYFSIVESRSGFRRNMIRNSYLGCCMAFHRDVLLVALPFPSGIIMHDIWIGLVGEIVSNPIFIEDKLIQYRRHGLNSSPSAEKSDNSLYFKLKYRCFLLFDLVRKFGLVKVIGALNR